MFSGSKNSTTPSDHPLKILAIDVGAGTQDILLYDSSLEMENCPKMVMPSRTRLVAAQIKTITERGEDILLSGNLMGGGPCSSAVKNHLKAGLKVYAEHQAAKTLYDDLDRVKDMGIMLVEGTTLPVGAKRIDMRDIDLRAIRAAFDAFGVVLPDAAAIAVQDHGDSGKESNRRFRFRHLEKILQSGGKLLDAVYSEPPDYLTRMAAVRQDVPGAVVTDTGIAAILGIIEDPIIKKSLFQGIIAVNIGNQHTLGVLTDGERMYGLFEHHTHKMDRNKVIGLVEKLRNRTIRFEEVFNDSGHGAAIAENIPGSLKFDLVGIAGPMREMLDGLGVFANPHGDMMMTGPVGLVKAYREKV